MGDALFAPKRKDVVDKLRRRLETYRQHHSASLGRYFNARSGIYEQQKQETLLLKQRWQDSKAKKAAKQSKASRDNNNTQSDHRNLVVTKLKRKIDSVSAEANTSSSTNTTTTTAAETVFNFDDKNHQSANINNKLSSSSQTGGGPGVGGTKLNTGLPSLSVQIVQQISSHPQQDTSQTIHTNVTVSSLYGNSNSPSTGGTSHSVHTSVQCKQEPSEDINSTRLTTSNNTPTTSSSTLFSTAVNPPNVGEIGVLGFEDVDELQHILDSIEQDEDIEPSLLKDLNEFEEVFDKVQRDSESNESGNMYGPLACGSPGLSKGVFPNLGPGGHLNSMFDNNQNMSAAMTNPTIPVPTAIPEPTGPAAETLKQMAAQHQHQHSPGYPMKGMDFSDGLRNGGFPPNYSPLYRSVSNSTSAFPYNHTTNHHMGDTSQMTPEMAITMAAYGGTKPLTHFPNEQGQQNNPPSSLQQLQNQVQSHFKPSSTAPHQMQITQTQHMQVSHGPHSMQLSQSQQVQMQPTPQQISLSQQQNFNMGQQQMVSEQIKMQMMEKIRMEQQQQAQQGRMPPQYMGRPPPEYKMPPNARPQGPYPTTTVSGGNQNPLQTMQNMVNQTSAYGAVKSEVASSASSGQAAQISAMQQQTLSASMASNGSHIGNLPQSNQGIRPGFHPQQHMQQPPAYSSVESSSRAQSSSTYTSAIMRNQRPPNVNVGPDGLNISQPRTHTDWPRATMMQSGHASMRPTMPPGGPGAHGMSQSAAMSAHMMQYQHRPPQYGAGLNSGSIAAAAAAATSMAQIQQQQQQVRPSIPPSQMRAGPGGAMMPNGSQMMMQHQGMQVTQQMSIHASSTSYSMGGPSPGTPSLPNSGYNLGGPSPGANIPVTTQQPSSAQPSGFSGPPTSTSSQDEFLHFLDNPLGSQPMFDSIQNSSTDDFSLFDDILNGK